MALLYRLLFFLNSEWEGWSSNVRNMYELALSLHSFFFLLLKSPFYHLLASGLGFVFLMFCWIVSCRAFVRWLAATFSCSVLVNVISAGSASNFILSSCPVPFLFVLVTIILTFVWLQHIFITSIFLLHPTIFRTLCLSIFCLPFSVHTLIPHLLTSVFHIPSYVPLFCFYYYPSTICPLFLAFPSWPQQLNISFPVTLWVIFYILCTTPFSILLRVL